MSCRAGGKSIDLNVGCFAYRAAGSQPLPTTTDTPVVLPNVRHDPGGDFSTVTYRWTAPSTGRYVVSGVVPILTAGASGTEARLYSSIHGFIGAGSDRGEVAFTARPEITASLYMLRNEQVWITAYQNSGLAATITIGGLFFTVVQVSRL